jgi:hypothetical protein
VPPAPLLGQAKIVIDQATLGPGAPGRARKDGVLGQIVTLRNDDNTNVTKHRWVLEKPRGSAATLNSSSSPSCQFTPDVIGTYKITLYLNQGTGRLQKSITLFAVTSPAGYRYPSQGEGAEANWNSSHTNAPNETGWWEDLMDILLGSTAYKPGIEALLDVDGSAENIVAVRTVGQSTHDPTKVGQFNAGVGGTTGDDYATLVGGEGNTAAGAHSFVGGGEGNTAGGPHSTVVGGKSNAAAVDFAVVGGGEGNSAVGYRSTIGGGKNNTAIGPASTIAGGQQNNTEGNASTVIGGQDNYATGDYSIAGGRDASAGSNYSIALGRSAMAANEGSVIVKDGNAVTATSSADHELTLSFHGGVRVLVPGSRVRISGFSNVANYHEVVQGEVQTTDATQQVVVFATIPVGQLLTVRGILQGKRVGTNAVRVHHIIGTYYANGIAATLLGGALKDNTAQADGLGAGYATSITTSGTTIQLLFSGTVGHTVAWTWDFMITMGGAA